MNNEQKKQAIIDTLDQVDKKKLPLFIEHLKYKTLMYVMFGLMTKETGDLLFATCDEYLRTYELEKYIEKVVDEMLEAHKTYHKPTVDISKLKPTDVMGVSE